MLIRRIGWSIQMNQPDISIVHASMTQIAAKTVLLTFCHALIGCSVLADSTDRFVQKDFVIGLWSGPARDLDNAYKRVAEAHFNLVVGTAGTNSAGQLKLCEKYNLQTLLSGSVDQAVPDSPSFMGYLICDEPPASQFPEMARLAEQVRAKRPGKLPYINLNPNYAPKSTFGGPTYDDYLAGFIKIVKPEVLCMDHYPVMLPRVDSRRSYCANLESCRKQSVAANIPFWNYFASMPFDDHIDPTEAQIRWQIFASIAYGAKGVLYFCYWTEHGSTFPRGGGVVTAEGLPTRHYDEARRINAEVKNWGPTLMKLKSTGVYRVTTTNASAIPIASGLTNLAGIRGDPTGTNLVGTFDGSDNTRAIVIVNDSYSYTGWLTVKFDVDPKQVQEVSKSTGKLEPIIDDSPDLPGLQLSFGAGDARLFIIPKK
jgi:hypothetical protein